MTDYRAMYDRDYVGAWDIAAAGPAGVTLVIKSVKPGELTAQGNRKAKKPIVHFEGAEKGLALNKTNGKTIAAMYGSEVEKWIGKRITIYATKTTFGSEEVDCIRVKPGIPADAPATKQAAS